MLERGLTFGGNEELLLDLVSVGITEVDDSKRSATAGVMDDVTDDTLKTVNVNINSNKFSFTVHIIIHVIMSFKQESQTATHGQIYHYPVGSAFASSGS